ncbi:MAG: hypothetical protein AAF152_18990 [Cyanobacteria bacterium P01_A01_bin.114]
MLSCTELSYARARLHECLIKAYRLDFGQRHIRTAVANLIRRMGVESDVFVISFNFWPMIWLERTYPRGDRCLDGLFPKF